MALAVPFFFCAETGNNECAPVFYSLLPVPYSLHFERGERRWAFERW